MLPFAVICFMPFATVFRRARTADVNVAAAAIAYRRLRRSL
jgi:hypothetical protein